MIKYLTLVIMTSLIVKSQTIVDFKEGVSAERWRIVDDVVMGGRSSGSFKVDKKGFGVFAGSVSLENNGGFSSIRHRFNNVSSEGHKSVKLTVKGDGKRYQFRLKENSNDYHSYINYFETNGKWQEITMPLKDFYPSFRGMKLNKSNFKGGQIEEISFLIGNKKAEKFQLLIDKIELV